MCIRDRVIEGTAGIHNLVYHDSGPYIISNATFPSYFQKDEDAVIESHARLDLAIFARIAGTLGTVSYTHLAGHRIRREYLICLPMVLSARPRPT